MGRPVETDVGRPDTTSGLLLTLHRGIQVLEQVGRDRGRATARSLGQDLGINLGTCYQLLRTLQANGYVHRLPGGRYGLGSQLALLADQYETSVAPPPDVIDILHDLHQQVGETVYVSVRRSRDMPIAEVIEGTRMLRVGNLSTGHAGYPHVRSSSKAILSHLPADELDAYLGGLTFESLTPHTIVSEDALLEELRRTRERGYGIDDEELAIGVVCVAAAILDERHQPWGAFAASFPAARTPDERTAIVEHVVAAAHAASLTLGHVPA